MGDWVGLPRSDRSRGPSQASLGPAPLSAQQLSFFSRVRLGASLGSGTSLSRNRSVCSAALSLACLCQMDLRLGGGAGSCSMFALWVGLISKPGGGAQGRDTEPLIG